MNIKPTIESLNQAMESSKLDINFKRKPIPNEKFYIKLKDPKTQTEYEIRYFF